MISIKDYAKQKNVSYEAVRKQLVRYKDELQSHITTKNRMRFLDDYAVNFLDQKRASSPIIIVQMDKDEEIERLKNENADLNRKIALLAEWKAENAVLIAEANQNKKLLEQKDQENKNLHVQIINYRVEVGDLQTSNDNLKGQNECLKADLTTEKEKNNEMAETIQNERLEHQNQMDQQKAQYEAKMDQQKAQHQAELEQQREEDAQQKAVEVAAAKEEWKKKGFFERVLKK